MKCLQAALLVTTLVAAHPSRGDGDPTLLSYWDRLDPDETLGEHQHSHGLGGGDISENAPAKNISVVHVVQSCHLDIGFTDTVVNVVNEYFDRHIPMAISTGKAMRNGSMSWHAEPGALSRGNDRPSWPRNTTVKAAVAACEADTACIGLTYRNGNETIKKIYLKGNGATDTGSANWTLWYKPPSTPIPPGWRLRFTMQAWYLTLYMHCPPGLGLHCPSDAAKAALKGAIKEGDITWHAFPHNAELEAGSAGVVRHGLRLTHALDAAFGQPPKRVLSQRDVPGLSRSMIPILKSEGVYAVSVGVNGASMYPRVPRIFRWRDPVSGEEVLAMWHARGYGGWGKGEAVVVPGFDHVLVTDWNADNRGLHPEREYIDHLRAIQKEWPHAQVVVSTFDNFTEQLIASGAVANLDVITREVGDSWIYGDPSDARKVAQMRALHRAWDAHDDEHSRAEQRGSTKLPSAADDPQLANATLFMLKNIEHTWGEHEHGLNYKADDWSNAGFARRRADTPAGYEALESTWWEQRRIGIDMTREALKGHPLSASVEDGLGEYSANCTPPYAAPEIDPATLGWSAVPPEAVGSTVLRHGDVAVGFDPRSGAISHLSQGGEAWAGSERRLLDLHYVTYSSANMSVFQRAYSGLDKPPSWFVHDFGKPGDSLANYTVTNGALDRMWTRGNGTEALLRVTLNSSVATNEYGAAPVHFWRIALNAQTDGSKVALSARLNVVGKPPTRHAEAMFVRFNPPQAAAAERGSMELNKLGQWVGATSSLVVDGGSKVLHGVQRGVRARSATNRTMTIDMLDSGVVSLGEPNGFPVALNASHPWAPPDVATNGLSSMLFNNLWGTNYVMWQPYRRAGWEVPAEANYAFRYEITWQ